MLVAPPTPGLDVTEATVKINLNTILTILGAGAVLAPDLTGLAAWLSGLGVPWLVHVAHGLGIASLFFASAPRVIAKLRPVLASLGLATPSGAAVQVESRDLEKGSASTAILDLFVIIALAAGVGLLLFWPMIVRAETSPQFGGCVDQGRVCFGPSATISVGQFNLSTSKFSGGVIPGVGYGATFAPDQWYATGLSLYASFLVGQGSANALTPSLMLSFANYVRLGAGVAITEQPSGPTAKQWLLLFGLGSDFGGSPNYVKQQAAARAAQ